MGIREDTGVIANIVGSRRRILVIVRATDPKFGGGNLAGSSPLQLQGKLESAEEESSEK